MRLAPISRVLYHTCFIREQVCRWWSCWLKLTLLVISDVRPILYIFTFTFLNISQLQITSLLFKIQNIIIILLLLYYYYYIM